MATLRGGRRLRIGIDCRTMLNPVSGERAGVGHYTYHLVRALLQVDRKNTYVLYFDHRMPAAVTDELARPNVLIRRLPFSRYRVWLPFAYSHLLLAAWLTRDRLDVFHAPANVMPLSYNRPTVVTIHDVAIYDHPEWFPPQSISTKLLVPQTVKKAAAVIAVSKTTKRDVLRLFRLPTQKVSVVYEAADTQLLRLRDRAADIRKVYTLPKRLVVYVGTIDPRKNLTVLVQAWQRLLHAHPKSMKDAALVIAGGAGYRGQEMLQLIAKLRSPSIRTIGYIPHNHKVKLMAEAEAFVFPTRYEGFGLPVLEAMQLGTPVITTNISAIPEIVGPAALLHKPDDVAALAAHIRTVLTRPAVGKKLQRLGRAQAKKFSWSTVAKQTLAVYQRVAR